MKAARAGSNAFILAISYIAILPPDVATDALRRRLITLRAELTTASANHGLPEYAYVPKPAFEVFQHLTEAHS